MEAERLGNASETILPTIKDDDKIRCFCGTIDETGILKGASG